MERLFDLFLVLFNLVLTAINIKFYTEYVKDKLQDNRKKKESQDGRG